MIDTDKYEGHLIDKAVEDNSQVWCWSKWLIKNAETTAQMNATAELLKDAPLLLKEVKWLRSLIEMVSYDLEWNPDLLDQNKRQLEYNVQKWEKKEMIE
tara:strand:+ start:436 stop:732 length:297 start_codon:yes stop_codon:yes gene_type:complete